MLNRVLLILVALLLLALAVTWAVDRDYSPLEWLPQEVRELNVFELLILPVLFLLWTISSRNERVSREREGSPKSPTRAKLWGKAVAQELMLDVVRLPGEDGRNWLRLHWEFSGSASGRTLEEYCGSPEGAAIFSRVMQASAADTATPMVLTATSEAGMAIASFDASHSERRRSQGGEKRPFVVVPIGERSGRVKQPRVFEIPPSLLLLFTDMDIHDRIATKRSVQWQRSIDLESVAYQVIGATGEVPAWVEFQSCYMYSIRQLPTIVTFDWWDSRWEVVPGEPISAEEIETKREALLLALSEETPIVSTRCFPVALQIGFAEALAEVRAQRNGLPKALHF